MSIPRYAITQSHAAQEDPRGGGWVLHSDHVAEVERLTAERDEGFRELARQHAKITRELGEMRAMWDKDSAARHRLTAERDGLAKALDLFLDRPPGASYHDLVERARAALAALPTPPKPE